MSNSPINFGAAFLGSAVSGFSSKKNTGKIRKRISKLENQVGAMISKQNQVILTFPHHSNFLNY